MRKEKRNRYNKTIQMTEKINTRAHQLVAQSKHPLSTGVIDTWIRSTKSASIYHSRQTIYAKFYICV